MKWVSFEEFIQKLRKAPKWRLEFTENGLTLLTTDQDGTVSIIHSPDPAKSSDVDWGLFSSRIGAAIDMKGSALKS